MTEAEFLQRWRSEKTMYDAWGDFVVSYICERLIQDYSKDLKSFLKVPVEHRLKKDNSLIDKAFYRLKQYANPYTEIEDKVGARFVVMLVSEISDISGIILKAAKEGVWDAVQCRDFITERNASPTIFTYQSDHFIIRSKNRLEHNSIEINENIPCEVQVRTLLQHAYAELTHDVIYKRKTIVKPEIQRTVAKTMAFIETADEFFTNVTIQLGSQTDQKHNVHDLLDRVYKELTGLSPVNQKSSIVIIDEFQDCIDNTFENKLEKFIREYHHIAEIIIQKSVINSFYRQSVIIFVYYLVRHRRTQLEANWPLEWSIIPDIAVDLGVALKRH
ncbi:GTP pyrophosphokinase [Klebsiella aerogenes]|uniref:GTP pyrophosphokinase n=1 Tax=Klebsiella aerogenes TaxID=548 RepID=UPI0028A36AE3|nr:RelA/SpoT domain-containing protein [Klebsiella aerogenes]MDT4323493.1 RelA/SpoT domain-containing protein [Klebsiella aerogenes]